MTEQSQIRKEYSLEAFRYLENAKKTLHKINIEYGRYADEKYVSEAAGIAYLAALKAIKGYFISIGINKFPKTKDGYRLLIRKHLPHNGKLIAAFNTVYENLHVFAYYEGGTEVNMVKAGMENVKKIILMLSPRQQ